MNYFIFFLVLISCIFAVNLNIKCNICECKPQKDIQTCTCQPSIDAAECERNSHELLISGIEILIPKKYSLQIIQSIIVNNISINALMVSFTNELLPKLYRLKFNNCNLTRIEKEAFFNITNITHLIMKNNFKLRLETDSFNHVQNLTYLDLENNNLNDFPVNIFSKLVKLEELYLDSNKLQNMSKEILEPLSNLQKIQIRKNEIQFIKNDLFKSNVNLKIINLNGNKIEFLNRTVVQDLSKLQYLYLDNNPLQCNCSLRDLFDEYKMRHFNISGECANNGFMFSKLERRHFYCAAKLINITKIQNDNSFNLSCTIESDGKPNAMWLYENNSLTGIKHNESFIMNTLKLYYVVLKLVVDPQKYYENNLTCFLNNTNSNETMYLPITYSPEFVQVKLNNFTEIIPRKTEEFEFKNISYKMILTHNFTVSSKNEFNITWAIQTLKSNKNIGLVFNLTNLKSNEYSASLILNYFEENFTGKCTLFVIDESSKINITKQFNIVNDINMTMTELLLSFQYKDNFFNFVESNNGNCSFVNNTQIVNSVLGQSYEYTCNFEPYKSGYLVNLLLIILFIAFLVIFFFILYKKCCIFQNHNQKVTKPAENLTSNSHPNIEENNEENNSLLRNESFETINDNNSEIPKNLTNNSSPLISEMESVSLSISTNLLNDEDCPNHQDSSESFELKDLESNSSQKNTNLVTDIGENCSIPSKSKEMESVSLSISTNLLFDDDCPNHQDSSESSKLQDLESNSSPTNTNLISDIGENCSIPSKSKELQISSKSKYSTLSDMKENYLNQQMSSETHRSQYSSSTTHTSEQFTSSSQKKTVTHSIKTGNSKNESSTFVSSNNFEKI